MTFAEAQSVLAAAGVKFAPGLTSAEFTRAEERFGFQFPPDLREFLAAGLPVSRAWVDWRNATESAIRERLYLPRDGIFFDIEQNAFWLDEWGARPANLSDAIDIARHAVAAAPPLIPVCSHRYIPAEPAEPGNPIFSVHQTDIIYYGAELMDYFHNEFGYFFGRAQHQISGDPRRIRFWSRLVDENE